MDGYVFLKEKKGIKLARYFDFRWKIWRLELGQGAKLASYSDFDWVEDQEYKSFTARYN